MVSMPTTAPVTGRKLPRTAGVGFRPGSKPTACPEHHWFVESPGGQQRHSAEGVVVESIRVEVEIPTVVRAIDLA